MAVAILDIILLPALAQGCKIGAVVYVIDGAVNDESRDGLDSRFFGFGEAEFILSQMNDLDVELAFIERGCKALFRINADRASGMIEYYFLDHRIFLSASSERRVVAPVSAMQ
ncbi:hypothetical protein [Agrobacterium burrii]|uniref:hypothetical protein n=1 Tax=Agrobacterium burrii TaxID=2815339 RepID=UPI003F79BDDD